MIAPKVPITIDKREIDNIKLLFTINWIKVDKTLILWRVAKRLNTSQEDPSYISGTLKWKGLIPSLKLKDNKISDTPNIIIGLSMLIINFKFKNIPKISKKHKPNI